MDNDRERQKRSRIMASIHSRDTRPELIVRRYLFARGFRFRLAHPRLPGRPDIVLRKYRTAIFVNGCFWHGHDCKAFHLPKTNTDFWRRKIDRNRRRDVDVQRRLAEMGWHCLTVWECELAGEKRNQTLLSLEFTLNHIYLEDRKMRYRLPDDTPQMAAEQCPGQSFDTRRRSAGDDPPAQAGAEKP
ncbi:very short patch repair endonuclease [Marseilla massiliensis]|jgi:DNA mismatch endonuclease (patch repair protein)|uniref:very short patch repair endonuclease n=1 Tax=Marseilla massiliensis TaxID=1841864 RepID=UPI0030C8211A